MAKKETPLAEDKMIDDEAPDHPQKRKRHRQAKSRTKGKEQQLESQLQQKEQIDHLPRDSLQQWESEVLEEMKKKRRSS